MMRMELSRIVLALGVVFLAGGCSPADQRQVQNLLDDAGKAAETAIAQSGPILQTKVAQVAPTVINSGRQTVEAAAGSIKQTADAMLATELARNQPVNGPLPVLDYFALGDSIASGHGLGSDGEPCQRSYDRSYPARIKKWLDQKYTVNFKLLACTGATAAKPLPANNSGKPITPEKFFINQAQQALESIQSDRLTLITISIGANDLQWTDPSIIEHLGWSLDSFLAWTDGLKAGIGGTVNEWVSNFTDNHPNVTVIVIGAYNPLNSRSILLQNVLVTAITDRIGTCNFFFILGNFNCYDRASIAVTTVNTALQEALRQLNKPKQVAFISTDGRFGAHVAPRPACGNSDPGIEDTWIQYPGDPNANVPVDLKFRILFVSWQSFQFQPGGDCFHPNDKGAQAIADLVTSRLTLMGK
jgi:lysophospholipase L1-like esterase